MTATPAEEPKKPSGRQERRRALTRSRLLRAAHQVMGQHGADNVNIADITAAADLGTGTFYNYFSSREEIFEAVAEASLERVGDALDRSVSGLSDPAEVWSGSLRHLVRHSLSEPVWGWFFVRMGAAHPVLMRTFGFRAHRDLTRGTSEQRFDIGDIDLAVACTFGALIAAVQRGLTTTEITDHDQRFAKAMLCMVGLPTEEARRIAALPLPAIDIEDVFPTEPA